MPVRAGTATPTFRLGTSAVSRMYLGSALTYSASEEPTTPTPAIPTPYAVTATATNTSTIVVQWRAATGVSGFQIQYSTDGGAQWRDSGLTYTTTTAAGVITGTATLASPTAGARYTFRVAATTAAGVGSYSNSSNGAIVYSKPTTPSSLSASTTTGGITLSWGPSTGTGSLQYWIQYSSNNGVSWSFLSSTGTYETYYNITIGGSLPLIAGQSYKFRVYAGYPTDSFVIAGDSTYGPISDYSAETGTVVAPATVPGQVLLLSNNESHSAGNLRFHEWFRTSVTETGTGGAVLRFTGPSYTGGSAVTSYRVYDDTNPASPVLVQTILASADGQYAFPAEGKYRTATVTWSAINAPRTLSVTAVNAAGESARRTVDIPRIVDWAFRVNNLTATPLAAGAKFTYPGGVTYDYRSAARAVSLAWSAPSFTFPGSATPTTPTFQIEFLSLAQTTEGWYRVKPFDANSPHAQVGRPYSQSGDTIDTLSPNTTYVVRVRSSYQGGIYGPFSYVTFTTVS